MAGPYVMGRPKIFMERRRITYDFRNKESFLYVMLPLLFLPFCFSISVSLLLKAVVFYVLPAALLFRFLFTSIRLTDDAIIIIKNLKPFRKVYRYSYKDLLSVHLGNAKGGPRIVFRFPGKRTYSMGTPYSMEQLCLFFLDKGIDVTSSNEDIRYVIAHYYNDPKANHIRQQQRKTRRENINRK